MFKLFLIATAILMGAPTVASTTAPTPPTAHVQIADLDLGAPAGVDQLDRRLRQAVRHVCPAAAPADLRTVADHRLCVREARRSATIGRQQLLARVADQQTQIVVATR